MSFEGQTIGIERGKDTLIALEKKGDFVFHGSLVLLSGELEPRQAKTLDKHTGSMINDGELAVVATPIAEVAIFRAVIDNSLRVGGSHWSSFGWDKDGDGTSVEYKTTKEIFDKSKESKGYVYVFRKEDFHKYGTLEYRAFNKVKPVRIFEVDFDDLPKNIKFEPFPHESEPSSTIIPS